MNRAHAEFLRLAEGEGQEHQAGAVLRMERLSTGEPLLAAAAGRRRAGGVAMQPDDGFHIASIGKTMTATLVLQLAEEGRLGPEGIDTALAGFDLFAPSVLERLLVVGGRSCAALCTVRHLLNHTSGMRDAVVDDAHQCGGPAPNSMLGAMLRGQRDPAKRWVPWDAERPDDGDAGVLNHYLQECAGAGLHAPGAAFHYSDTGYVVLGLLVQHLERRPLHQLCRERIFDRLALRRTYLAYVDDPAALDAATREPESEPWFGDRPCLSRGISLSFDWAGGGQVSSAADLAVFMRALWRGELFSRPQTLPAMREWIAPPGLAAPRTGVGLGLFRTRWGELELIGHSGAWGSRMVVCPALDLLLCGTLNRTGAPDDWHARVLLASRPDA